jgi:hypothetical protein
MQHDNKASGTVYPQRHNAVHHATRQQGVGDCVPSAPQCSAPCNTTTRRRGLCTAERGRVRLGIAKYWLPRAALAHALPARIRHEAPAGAMRAHPYAGCLPLCMCAVQPHTIHKPLLELTNRMMLCNTPKNKQVQTIVMFLRDNFEASTEWHGTAHTRLSTS